MHLDSRNIPHLFFEIYDQRKQYSLVYGSVHYYYNSRRLLIKVSSNVALNENEEPRGLENFTNFLGL